MVAELAVIFIGVLMALAADGWRERRSERSEARESLSIVLVDLRRDSAYLHDLASFTEPRNAAGRWLLERWSRSDLDPDSLASALRRSLVGRPEIHLNRAGFDGLIGANGLRLVDDRAVRGGLLEYYQTTQPNFEGFVRMAIDLRLQAQRTISPYVDFTGDSALLKLESPWSEVARNDYLRHDLFFSTGIMTAAIDQQLPVLQARINELIGLLDVEVEGKPR